MTRVKIKGTHRLQYIQRKPLSANCANCGVTTCSHDITAILYHSWQITRVFTMGIEPWYITSIYIPRLAVIVQAT